MTTKLVAYFSASGKTEEKAKALADILGADIQEIEPQEIYTHQDLDWTNTKSRSSIEMNDPTFRPAMKEYRLDMDQYDEIYIGFPIWWYTAPTIINTFLETNDLKGKKLYLFGTSGGSGIAKSLKHLTCQYPDYHFEKAVLLNGAVTSNPF